MPSRREGDVSVPERQRLDKWLWHARFARARPLAAKLICDGHVRVNGARAVTVAHGVKRGDVLTLALARAVLVIRIRDFGERRGAAEEARQLYDVLAPAETPSDPGN